MASLAAACNLTRKTEEIEEQLSILQVAPETNKKKSKFPASVRSVKKNTRSRFSKWVRRMPWKRRKEKSVKKSKEEQNTSIIDEEYVAYDDIYQTGTESEYEDIDDEPTEYKKQCSSNKKNAKKHKKVGYLVLLK